VLKRQAMKTYGGVEV